MVKGKPMAFFYYELLITKQAGKARGMDIP